MSNFSLLKELLLGLLLLCLLSGCGGGSGGGAGSQPGTLPSSPVRPDSPRLVFVDIPQEIIPGQPFQIEVALVDGSGNLVSSQDLSVVIVATGGSLEGNTDARLVGGRAVFSSLTLEGSGPFTLTVTSGSLRATVTINADLKGLPAQLRFISHPLDSRVGEELPTLVSAEVLDLFGNRVLTPVNVSLSLQPAGTLSGTLSKTSINGVVHFGPLVVENTGTYRLAVSATGLIQDVSNPFRVLPPIRFGRFLSRRDFRAPRGANALERGDLNGDGVDDIVRFHSNGVSTSLNSGDGVLTESFSVSDYHGFADGVLVNLNGDEAPDFVSIEEGGNGILFLGLGDGAGSFQVVEDGDFGDDVQKVVSGDFNKDLIPDIAALFVDGDELAIRLGEGDGTFAPAAKFALSSIGSGRQLEVGDFDDDDCLDLVVGSGNIEAPEVYFGLGDGTFQTPAVPLSFATACSGLAVQDLNGDLNDDIVLARYAPQEDLVVLLGSNTGSFNLSATLPLDEPREVWISDVTGDREFDIVTTTPDSIKDRVAVFPGTGNGSFTAGRNFVTAFGEPKLCSVDTNSDTVEDIVTVNPISGTLSIYTAVGSGEFRIPFETAPLSNNPKVALTGDFDEDGFVDIFPGVAGNVLLGQGDGTFTIQSRIFSTGASGVSGDLDGDGHIDCVFTDYGSGTVLIHFGRGDGTFEAVQVLNVVDRPGEIEMVDVNLDGRMDLAVESGTSGLVILPRNSGRTFASPQPISIPLRSSARHLKSGFLNSDAYPDFALANSDFALIVLSDGSGGFQAPNEYPAGKTLTDIDIGDIDEDGTADIALSSFADDDIRVLYNDGNGVFSSPQILVLWDRLTRVVLSDFNLDGHLDVAGLMDRYCSFGVYYGNGEGGFQEPEVYGVGSDPSDLVSVDLNNDGANDIVAPDSFSRRMTAVLNERQPDE